MRRNSAGVPPSSGKAARTYGAQRVCASPACATKLSRYNPEATCFVHSAPVLRSGARA
jgi:hypothetical protein